MSISQRHYVMIGYEIDVDSMDEETWEEIYDEYGEGDKPYYILYDGMNGEYAIFGKIIAEGDQYEGMALTSIDYGLLTAYKGMVEDKYYEVFNDADQEAKLFCVTHWC